jgi:hypothetical protein
MASLGWKGLRRYSTKKINNLYLYLILVCSMVGENTNNRMVTEI